MKHGKRLLAVLLSILMLGLIAIPGTAESERETCPECHEVMLTMYLTYQPDCEATGYTLWKCANPDCAYSEQRDIIPALGHEYTMIHVEGSCTKDTYDYYSCGRCGGHYKDNVVAAPGHVFGEAVHEEPTCTDYERDKYTCAVCGEIKYEKTVGGDPALGHYMELYKRPETCADEGFTTYKCSVCGFENKVQTAVPEHTDADNDNVCDVCGASIPVREEDHGFFAKIVRWITDIITALKSLIDGIKA